ncbi:hypothetical protein [Ruegeria profundi]|uniref:hypothetical protein n=1 Tax=Ruegeria profundi TaxID=1685378 RepID=UPI003C7CAE2C
MNGFPRPYRVQDDGIVWRLLVALCVILSVLTALSHYEGRSDDVLRWVVVSDLLNGQGWLDLYQHRLGPNDGTLMHWSRLVDAPIAALYLLFSLVLSEPVALHVTAIVWPSMLVMATLWALVVTAGALGGRPGAISALIFGALALEGTKKYTYFSFDHHGLQIMLYVFSVMFFVRRKTRIRASIWLGVFLALSMSIGTESLMHLGLIGAFFAIDWVLLGEQARTRLMSFGAALAVTLLVVSVATTSADSFFFPGCDALTLSVALPAGLAGFGLLGLGAVASAWSIWARAFSLLSLGVLALGFAYVFAPYCLQNPISQMSQPMQEFWLSQITEAQAPFATFSRHTGQKIALFGVSVFTILAGLYLSRARDTRIDYLLLVFLMSASLTLFLYQSRMSAFLAISLIVVHAQVLGAMFLKYKAQRSRFWGVLMMVFFIFMLPKTGTTIERFYVSLRQPTTENSAAGPQVFLKYCNTQVVYDSLNDLSPGLIVSGFDFAANILRFTHHSVLGGNYHRNEAGNLSQIDLFRSDPAEMGQRLADLRVDYVLICKHASRAAYWNSVSEGEGLPSAFLAGRLPNNVHELQRPEHDAFRVFQVKR